MEKERSLVRDGFCALMGAVCRVGGAGRGFNVRNIMIEAMVC